MSSFQKVKTVAKVIQPKGKPLTTVVTSTMKTIAEIVGATLGPGGNPVLIERQETDLPAYFTKDGVTVFRSLGFQNPAAHCIMEVARDASVRTASEAGDGTTTATVLAEAIVRHTNAYCAKNPQLSPQKIVRVLQKAFQEVLEPLIKENIIKSKDWSSEEGRQLLRSVAKISANGDDELADAVLECFRLVGDDGNVTIVESSGPSHYEVERIEGYPVGIGYEECCTKFYPKFINDTGGQRCILSKPAFLVYHGRITEIQSLLPFFGLMQEQGIYNIVIVATGFSEGVLGALATNFPSSDTANYYPLLIPQSPLHNGQLSFAQDIAAVTGAKVLDPLSTPLEVVSLDQIGRRATSFEAQRFRSTVIGEADEDELLVRVDQLQAQLRNAVSRMDQILLEERIGKLTGGIAKLKVIGASGGETKEKRDRAEDAVCAVRGAIKHGCLPGGGWTLLVLAAAMQSSGNEILQEVLARALVEPPQRLLGNCGLSPEEIIDILDPILLSIKEKAPILVYDALECKHVSPVEGGVLDSAPAVLEAVRNSISIASLLGTLGGTVVFARDLDLERKEAQDTLNYLRNVNGPTDE